MSAEPRIASGIVVRPGTPRDRSPRPWSRRAYKSVVGGAAVSVAWLARGLTLGAAGSIGGALGEGEYLFSPENRRIALENLAAAFPEKSADERRAIAREAFRSLGTSGLEWAALSSGNGTLDRSVTLSGTEHADAALARGRGCMWITAHFGNWEMMAARVSSYGYRCSVIATTVRYAALNRYTIALRGSHGVDTIERESDNAGREVLRRLRANQNIGILLDLDTRIPSVQVEFFGRPAWTAIGPAEIAVRLGCAAVPSFPVRQPDGRYVVEIGAPIFPPENVPKSDVTRAARDLTQVYTRAIEEAVRRHPGQWAWMHKRWKK